jgi:alkylation response protein AidB-like acyl-CoA dehydrogenase
MLTSEKVKKYLPLFKEFVTETLIPCELNVLYGERSSSEAKLQELREAAKGAGLWAPHLGEHEGGLGMNMMEFAQVSEILALSPLGHYSVNAQAPDIGNMELMEKYASDELKKKYLEPLQKGEIRSCFSMTEPENAGSNPVVLSTTAEISEGSWVINGTKWFTTSADGAEFAIVMAVTNQASSRHQRASMILVPSNASGFNLVRNIPIMGEEGYGYFSHSEIQYENCRVPHENLIGEEGSGFLLAQERLGPGRIHHCMRWIGICERALDLMCRRAVMRDMGDGSFLSDKQTIQNWIAESRAEINASRYLVLHAAEKLDKQGAKAARIEISTIKFFVADVLMKVLDRAIQVHGALGVTDDTVLSFWYRHERGARIYDGPDEVHKGSLARAILKKYRGQV